MRREPGARDAGLRRVRTLTRWLVAGGVVASGALSLAAARAHPGRTTDHVTTAPAPAPQPDLTVPSFDDDGGGDGQLAPPPAAPVPARGGGVVVSGGS